MSLVDGIEYLKGQIAGVPTAPGVYRMLGEGGVVLYVGKAKHLQNRLRQYTQPERMVTRIRKMVFETRELVVVQTRTEAEALLLEANLIKSLKPKYNIIFRDDSSYVSVVITHDDSPQVRAKRGARKGADGTWFGPYPSAGAVYETLDLMERAFKLRTCEPGVFRHRTRPCLKYDIGRCSGPCVGKISPANYARTVAEAKRFLRGDRTEVLADLQAQMAAHAAALDYEAAKVVRDRIKALSAVHNVNNALTHALPEADVLALVRVGDGVAVQVFYYRHGAHVGNSMFYPRYEEEDMAEVMRVFVALHYAARGVPRLVLCNVLPADAEALMEALAVTAGHKVVLEVPQRGDKAAVMQQAEANARAALERKQQASANWQTQLEALGELLGREVKSVECYDISNTSGTNAVASGVAADAAGMAKGRYKRYAIKTKTTPDDYAMLREVLGRRLKRGAGDDEGKWAWPDVMLIDGGKGQLGVLVSVVTEMGLLGEAGLPALVSIAKGEDRDKGLEVLWWYEVADGEVKQLPIAHGSGLIFVLQQIRDEAHRFAITYHRAKRAKALVVSGLDAIAGIGPKKKRALLLHFGSVEGVRAADVPQLMQVAGVSRALAEEIYATFRG